MVTLILDDGYQFHGSRVQIMRIVKRLAVVQTLKNSDGWFTVWSLTAERLERWRLIES